MLETNSLIRNEEAVIQCEQWKVACTKTLDKHVPVKERAKLKPLMTQEIMEMMNKRRNCKQNILKTTN